MLVIDDNSVYEIDEECLKTKKVPKECGVYEKIQQQLGANEKDTNHEKNTENTENLKK